MKITSVTNFFGFTKPSSVEVVPQRPVAVIESEKKIFHSWIALARPERKAFNKKFIKTMTVIGVVVCLLLALMQEIFLIIAIASIIFISYVLTKTPPEQVHHEISTHGVKYADYFYSWNDLKYFFFSKASDLDVLVVGTKDALPGRLFFAFDPVDKEKLKEIFDRYIPFLEKEPVTFIDKIYYSFLSKLNFD